MAATGSEEGSVSIVSVDDDRGDRAILGHLLAAIESPRVELEAFGDPLAALSFLEGRKPDVLLLDHHMGPAARARGVRLESEVAADLPELDIDEQPMLQVVGNLVGHAIEFTEAGGSVLVRCLGEATEPDAQTASVQDTGRGIAAEELGQVFERLDQTEGEAAIRGGMGFGLHISRELVRLHGSDIEVERTVGQGSTFRFTLRGA